MASSVRRRRWRWWLVPAAVGVGFALIEAAAALRVGRARAQRATLAGRLFVRELGVGPPVVFLAGLAGTSTYWGHEFDALADNRRLLFVDALGFGHSPWPDIEYTLEQHLEALRRTLLARGAGARVTLVGHSFGALLAAHYAARFPDEVERVVLLGTPIFRDAAEARARIRAMSRTAGLFSLNRLVARETCKLHEALGPILIGVVRRIDGGLPPEVLAAGTLHTWQAFDGSLRNVVLGAPIETPLECLGARVTFVHGRRDLITPLPRVWAVASDLGATVIETDDDHGSYAHREPAVIASVLTRHP